MFNSLDEQKDSLDLFSDNLKQLQKIFPQVVENGKVNFTKLSELLDNDKISEEEEQYNFTWYGKNSAKRVAYTPTTSTLIPQKEQSKNWDTTQTYL